MFKVYFFNVTNADDVQNKAAKPTVKEIGPYVYDLWKKKEHINLTNNNEWASYFQNQDLFFNQELSEGLREDDKITMLNAAMMGAVLDADKAYQYGDQKMLKVINNAIDDVFQQPDSVFNTYSVSEWLFDGVRMKCNSDTLTPAQYLFCLELSFIADPDGAIRPDVDEPGTLTDYLYSYFYATNASYDGKYTINTGIVDPRRLGWIEMWEDSATLPFWSGPQCNQILGTDAAIFPPFLTRESRINIFSSDLCRSLYAVYQQDIEYRDIPGYRYVASHEQLANVKDNPENYCWCSENAGCLKEGSVDLYPCQDAAVVLTFPHFYQAARDYQSMVDGLSPNQQKHETFLDLEPYTGVPLRGAKRIQFNMMVKPVRNIQITNNLPEALIPLLWVDEGVELDEENANLLRSSVYGVITALQALRWVLVTLGVAGVGAAVVVYFCCC
ncbi:hypothetical protein B566_EDAN012782 [Ephemera danica]|nr:hypothetical protein B566_EDAN012782 [Ephemera danica]